MVLVVVFFSLNDCLSIFIHINFHIGVLVVVIRDGDDIVCCSTHNCVTEIYVLDTNQLLCLYTYNLFPFNAHIWTNQFIVIYCQKKHKNGHVVSRRLSTLDDGNGGVYMYVHQ
jgi:hypothetical protein